MTTSTITFQLMLLYHIWISLPLTLIIFSAPQNIMIYLGYTSSCHFCYLWKICYYIEHPLLFPTTSCTVLLLSLHSTYHHKWQPFTYKYENRILLQVPWWENMLQKSRFDCSVCSINKRFYYFHGPVIIGPQWSTCFIQNHHCIAFSTFDWCVCLPSIHYLTCWTYFCARFLHDFLFPHSSNSYVWSAWRFHLVLLLFSILTHVMIALSEISDLLTIFMPITGF